MKTFDSWEIEKSLANFESVSIPFCMWNREVHNELLPTYRFIEVIAYDDDKNRLGKFVSSQWALNNCLETCWLSPLDVYYMTNGTMGVIENEVEK